MGLITEDGIPDIIIMRNLHPIEKNRIFQFR